MSKKHIDQIIKGLKEHDYVIHCAKWQMEAIEDQEYHVRFLGLKIPSDWKSIINPKNNILLKFITSRKQTFLEYYLANQPPFTLIVKTKIDREDTYKDVIGPFKQQLNRDKLDYQRNKHQFDNIYLKIKPSLK